MLSPEDFLNTPTGYATPDQLASVRQYADLLTKGGMRDQQITSPWQGVRMLADTLAGTHLRNQAAQQQMQGYDSGAGAVAAQPPAGASLPQPQSDSSSGDAQGGPVAPAYVDAIKGFEGFTPKSQWDVKQYSYGYGSKAPGPGATIDPQAADQKLHGDLASASSVVDAVNPNLSPGTKAALTSLTYNAGPGWVNSGLGKAVAAGDEATAKKIFMQYSNVAGEPNKVIAARRAQEAQWFGQGDPSQTQGQGQALAFNGTPSQGPLAMPGTPQSAAMALRGQPSTEPPVSKVGDPQMGPQFAPSRPQISQQQLYEILRNPWGDPDIKRYFFNAYMMQNQPTSAAGPGGNWVFDHNGNKVWVPELQKGELKAGDVSGPYIGTLGEPSGGGAGQYTPAPGVPSIRPAAQAPKGTSLDELMNAPSPWTTPQAPVPGGAAPAAPGPQGAITPQGAPTAAAVAMPMGQAAAAGAQASAAPQAPAPVQTAMATPEGVKSDAPPIGAGILGAGVVPPIGASPTAIPPAPEPQLAQASGGLPTLNDLADFANQNKYKQELNQNNAKHYADNSNAVLAAGAQATQSLPMIDMAAQAVKDPRFYSGIFSEGALDIKKLQAAFGDDPNAAAAMEVFTKAMAGDVLSQLRSKLQGLGQVRLAEIQLINQATANMHNTPAANLAVLNIIRRSYQQTAALSQIADAYNNQANPPTNAGLESTLQKYLLTHPTFSPDEIKNFRQTLSLDDKASKPEATTYSKGTPPPAAAPPASTGMDLTHPDLIPNIDEEIKRRGLK